MMKSMKIRHSLGVIVITIHMLGCASVSPSTERSTTDSSQAIDSAVPPQAAQPELRDELLAMSKADQELRQALIVAELERPNKELLTRMAAVDSTNTARMKQIIQEYGWPGISMVGEDGATAAFLIVQHADHDPAFQKQALSLLRAAYEAGETSGEHLALLTDRVLVAEGMPQLYGSQTVIENGKVVVKPVEDEPNLDKRRMELGLPPIAEYMKLLKQVYGLEQ